MNQVELANLDINTPETEYTVIRIYRHFKSDLENLSENLKAEGKNAIIVDLNINLLNISHNNPKEDLNSLIINTFWVPYHIPYASNRTFSNIDRPHLCEPKTNRNR